MLVMQFQAAIKSFLPLEHQVINLSQASPKKQETRNKSKEQRVPSYSLTASVTFPRTVQTLGVRSTLIVGSAHVWHDSGITGKTY